MEWGDCLYADSVATIKCIPVIAKNLITAAFSFVGIVALFVILWAGFKLVRSKGDEAQIEEAKRTLTYGVVGIIIILSVFFIIRLITTITGVNQLNPFVAPAPPPASTGVEE